MTLELLSAALLLEAIFVNSSLIPKKTGNVFLTFPNVKTMPNIFTLV